MSKKFFDYKPSDLRFVTFDIETTGFKAGEDDIITTVIAHDEDTYHIWLNTHDNDVSQPELKEEILEGSSTINNIMLYVSDSEKELLTSFSDYITNLPKTNTVITAFNGETYRGATDFDIPFLRTRYFMNGLSWPFTGYWYSDSYEIFSQKNRFNTTVTEEPSLDNLKSDELKQLVDDMNLNISYNSMNKSTIVKNIQNYKNGYKMAIEWDDENNINRIVSGVDDLTKSQLKQFINDAGLDICYKKLTKEELKDKIKEKGYDDTIVSEWYEKINREYDTMNMTTLDGIHEKIIESNMKNKSWVENLPINLELFEPFDPYENSEEAVEGFKNKEYSNLILHCLADVARTVNLTRIMIEYMPQQDYRPKIL